MARQHAAALANDLFLLFLVRLHGDPFLSQTHLTQALCELRGAYPGRGVVLQAASDSSFWIIVIPTCGLSQL
jgi:hypothetical protein